MRMRVLKPVVSLNESSRLFCSNSSTPATVPDKDVEGPLKLDAESYLERNHKLAVPYMAREELGFRNSSPAIAPGEEGRLSGTSQWTEGRQVTIYKQPLHAMQSATYKTRVWKIRFNTTSTWVNPLMGWTSTNDPLVQLQDQQFESEDKARNFCIRQGWKFEVAAPQPPKHDFNGEKDYADNFLTSAIKVGVKAKGEKFFDHGPTAHTSAWVNQSRSDYGGEKHSDDSWKNHRDKVDA